MFKRTTRAAVWVGPSPEPGRISMPAISSQRSVRVLWASEPFKVPSGVCVGVKLAGDTIMVAIRRTASPDTVEWVHAIQVLTAAEANRWAAKGFTSHR